MLLLPGSVLDSIELIKKRAIDLNNGRFTKLSNPSPDDSATFRKLNRTVVIMPFLGSDNGAGNVSTTTTTTTTTAAAAATTTTAAPTTTIITVTVTNTDTIIGHSKLNNRLQYLKVG